MSIWLTIFSWIFIILTWIAAYLGLTELRLIFSIAGLGCGTVNLLLWTDRYSQLIKKWHIDFDENSPKDNPYESPKSY